VTAAAPLRAWLDERRAEIEHDHRDSWTGNPNTCYCDVPRPCADRARELEAVDGLVAVLDEREALLARVAVMEAHPWIKVVWLVTDDEGNSCVWNDPDRARRQLVHDWTAETPGSYEWVNDADRMRELLLRDGEPTGLTLRMALVADADEGT
jgi:hypothetical protein